MAVRITDMKGKQKATQYSDKDVGRMVKKTERIPGSVLRKATGADKVLKLQGRKPTRAARREVLAAVKAGKGGFAAMGGKGRRGGGRRSGT